ncbi:hypothetical protein J6590_055155 [Homalodisca vitripennis]|nr:hypothetical protein J6590_055155 [Homalodisca vitripennis]
MRKDIKKSSYYVWFLGAQEAKGLRGLEYITPVIRSLVEQEREMEPFKVTLQVSHKGLKIVQNVPGPGVGPGVAGVTVGAAVKPTKAVGGGSKPEVVKHLIPHHAVTCVHQQEDLVACILLLYNPVTKCPVHVHAYRCDSVETATVLHGQLRVLIERPDNQKKLSEIEARLTAKGLLLPQASVRRRVAPPGSDGRSTRESESSGGSSSERLSGVGHQERIANLYDSLAAELREKLGSGGPQAHAPILLPPRDYDTVHRQKGNLSEINARRCLNMNIVGMNATAPPEGATGLKPTSTHGPGKIGSSGGSSGIGSDHAPSPDQETDTRFLDNHSTSGLPSARQDQLVGSVANKWNGDHHQSEKLLKTETTLVFLCVLPASIILIEGKLKYLRTELANLRLYQPDTLALANPSSLQRNFKPLSLFLWSQNQDGLLHSRLNRVTPNSVSPIILEYPCTVGRPTTPNCSLPIAASCQLAGWPGPSLYRLPTSARYKVGPNQGTSQHASTFHVTPYSVIRHARLPPEPDTMTRSHRIRSTRVSL